MNKKSFTRNQFLCCLTSIIFGCFSKVNAQNLVTLDDHKTLFEDEAVVLETIGNSALNKSEITPVVLPNHGTLDTTGSEFKYTPFIGYNGKDELVYRICRDSCKTARVSFTIMPIYSPLVIEGVSPDGDGINDAFGIKNVDYKTAKVSVQIFNRWGTKIFSEQNYDANNSSKNWVGQSNSGEEVLDGTYFYVVEIPSLKFNVSGYLMFIGNK